MKSVLTVTLILIAAGVQALEVRVQPGDSLYIYGNAGEGAPSDLYTAVIQNIAMVNDRTAELELTQVEIEVIRAGKVVQRHLVDTEELAAAARLFCTYQEHGFLEAYDFQFQTRSYLQGIRFPGKTHLGPGDAIVIQGIPLLLKGLPDEVLIRAEGRNGAGELETATTSLAVIDHHSPNEYWLPVRGRWLVAAAPSLHSHHRWAAIQEFALDLIQIGEEGKSHLGDGSQLDMYHAYGEPVVAIGDGVVVAAVGGLSEADDNLQQSGESAAEYSARSLASQQALLSEGFIKVLGNHVVIEHPHGEYSHYLHLQHNSVSVSAGDTVKRGQVIGRLGHSGNSTEPHLHFHVADGPDPATSRSIPVEFKNITLWPADNGLVRHLHSGQVVMTRD